MHAVYIPSMTVSEEFQFDHSLIGVQRPIIIDRGNFLDAKTRFYPVITASDDPECHLQFILFKISVDDEQVNITVIWKLDLPKPDGTKIISIAHGLCTNNECCAFFRGSSIYYVRYDISNMKLKSISNVYFHDIEPNGTIYLVHDVVFYTLYTQDNDEYEMEQSHGARKSLFKLNFDGINVPLEDDDGIPVAMVDNDEAHVQMQQVIDNMNRYMEEDYVSDVPLVDCQIQHICDYVSVGSFNHKTGDIVGRNLYKSSNDDHLRSDGQTTRVFLDQNIEKNHLQERETVYDRGHDRFNFDNFWSGLEQKSPKNDGNDIIFPTVFSTRLNPASGSSLVDVAYVEEEEVYHKDQGIRFQVYMDDETLLQSEISECLSGN